MMSLNMKLGFIAILLVISVFKRLARLFVFGNLAISTGAFVSEEALIALEENVKKILSEIMG